MDCGLDALRYEHSEFALKAFRIRAFTIFNISLMLFLGQNVTRINMQMGRTFSFAAWQPNTVNNKTPHINAPFHGHAYVADFISSKGTLQVSRLHSPATHVSAYAGYHGGNLAKVAVTNLMFWQQGLTEKRPSASVTLDLGLGPEVKQVTVRKLWGPDSVALEDVSWAGQTWPYNTTGMPVVVRNDTETVDVKSGKILVDISASTVVLVTW
jgi:hypothetical protein